VRPPRLRDGTAPNAVLRRRRALAAGAVALAILIAVIIAVVASGGGGGNSTEPTISQTTTPVTTQQPTTTTTATTTSSTPALHVTVPQGGHLSSGDNGSEVETLQKALAQLGLYDGKVDGDFGSGTEAAVVEFQKAHNLTPDGIVGEKTADAINQALASQSG
jgi:peptidoglycan hydrolase-like protein with peptidoglycan-binding domain